MIATGILAFILLVCHKKFHACNILNIYDNNEKINLVTFDKSFLHHEIVLKIFNKLVKKYGKFRTFRFIIISNKFYEFAKIYGDKTQGKISDAFGKLR
jgi:hypothetical protein